MPENEQQIGVAVLPYSGFRPRRLPRVPVHAPTSGQKGERKIERTEWGEEATTTDCKTVFCSTCIEGGGDERGEGERERERDRERERMNGLCSTVTGNVASC